MDNESYDQLTVPPDVARPTPANYIVDGSTVVLQMYGDEIVGSDLPAAVELNVTDTEPGVQGDRVSGARKPATLETGLTVQVPLFVNPGDRIKVDTRTAEYITRSVTPRRGAARRARARPRPALRGRDQGLHRHRGAGRPARSPPDEFAAALVRAVDEHHDRIDGLLSRVRQGLDAWRACRRSTAPRCAWAPPS